MVILIGLICSDFFTRIDVFFLTYKISAKKKEKHLKKGKI